MRELYVTVMYSLTSWKLIKITSFKTITGTKILLNHYILPSLHDEEINIKDQVHKSFCLHAGFYMPKRGSN